MVTISLALFLESWPYFGVKLWHCQYFVEFDSFRIQPEISLRRICEPFASLSENVYDQASVAERA